MSKLVVIDADVLGRERTGDESYVENLLRELAEAEAPLRLAAITRQPHRVPPGIEPLRLDAHSQSFRMAVRVPSLLRRMAPQVSHFHYVVPPRAPGRVVLTVHDLSFERRPEFEAPIPVRQLDANGSDAVAGHAIDLVREAGGVPVIAHPWGRVELPGDDRGHPRPPR